MIKEKDEKNPDSNQKKSALIWYSIAVIVVILFNIFPTVTYHDSWTNAFTLIDSSSKVNDPKIKSDLIERGGMQLIPIIKVHPYHARLQMLMGYYYFLKGNMDSVINYETKALELGSGGVVNSVEPPAKELLGNATINKGISLLAKGDTISAFKLYGKTARFVPENKTVNKFLADYYLSKNKPDAALFHYYSLLKYDFNDSDAMLGLAKCYYSKGVVDSARYYSNAVLKKTPSNLDAQNLLNLVK